jgi:outer membrane protein assembly factor BamB
VSGSLPAYVLVAERMPIKFAADPKHPIVMNRLLQSLLAGTLVTGAVSAENWAAWRGPTGDGQSGESGIPVTWSEGKNIVWKKPFADNGHASPIVWENRLFLIAANLDREQRQLVCLDADSGKTVWERTVVKSPLERKHRLNSWASSTPATDGKTVYIAFLDEEDMVVAAYDFAGNQKWLVRPGVFSSRHGFCSSPVIWKDKLIVNGDHDGESYIVGLNRQTGKTLWKTPRPNKTRSYCVPTIYRLGNRNQMVLSGDQSVASYDPDTGQTHWYLKGPTEQFVASLVYNPKADLLFMTGGFPEHHIMGLRHSGQGVIDDQQVAWHHTRASWTSYVPSPISEGDYFLIVSDTGYACCFAAKTGELQWQEKLGKHHASLVSADGNVYFLSDQGECRVIKPGPEYRLVSENILDDKFMASPAISNGRIYLRGEKSIYCVGASRKQAAR